jgi:hypothetical protein
METYQYMHALKFGKYQYICYGGKNDHIFSSKKINCCMATASRYALLAG